MSIGVNTVAHKKKPILAFMIACMIFQSPVSSASLKDLPDAVPYGEDEFPKWLTGIRRAEIIAVGVFPFAFLLSRVSYGIYRYAANDFQSEYMPEILSTGSTVPLEREEKVGVILAGVGVSLSIALIDFIIVTVRQKRSERERNASQTGTDSSASREGGSNDSR